MVQGVVVAHIVWALQLLHVVDLGPRKLVRVLNWALALLLVDNGAGDALLHCYWFRSSFLMLVTLIGILVAL